MSLSGWLLLSVPTQIGQIAGTVRSLSSDFYKWHTLVQGTQEIAEE